ncbi:MAG: alpha-galactosidase [Sedimentisphaerales bacterium]|nr:alpha-galactosidase [Sedimentisphaerales bacterium]
MVFVSLLILLSLSQAVIAQPTVDINDRSWNMVNNEWQIRFEEGASTLTLLHQPTGAEIAGKLSFTVKADGRLHPWSIILPRDSVSSRLSILDRQSNVQGYITVSVVGGSLHITVVHRPLQNYEGELTLDGTMTLGRDTFACRTRPLAAGRVVQMASGNADSALNDSLFDIATDTALCLSGHSVVIRTLQQENDKLSFTLRMSAIVHNAAHSSMVFDVVRDYYRSRYIPHYKPINKHRCPSPPTGWMSWYAYFGAAGEEDNLAEARLGAKYLKPFGLEYWHIESWQESPDRLNVRKFHNLSLQSNSVRFPHGMKWLADEIRKLGFRPGIWTVPFGTGDKAFYEAHRGWFLHDVNGRPMQNWCGLYVFDPSQRAARQHIEDTHRTMSRDWGYEYFKIDGMSAISPGYSAHFYERPEVRAAFKEKCDAPFRLCIEALRRGIGEDRIWLACLGHYSGPEVGYVDASRVGMDLMKPDQLPEWHGYYQQARCTLNQLFVHSIIWHGYSDTLLVGHAPMPIARLATTVVGLPGQMMFSGDKLAELSAERMRLLQSVLPVCDVRPLDLFPILKMLSVWDLKIRRPFGQWDVVSLFNWGDESADLELRFEEIGLSDEVEYLVYDFWNQSLLGCFSRRFTAVVAARSNRLLAVHPFRNRPQFLSTDRHITQGGISLESLTWDQSQNHLSGSVRLVGNFPSRLVFYVPEGYVLKASTAEGAQVTEVKTNPDGTMGVTIQRPTSGSVKWRLVFDRI